MTTITVGANSNDTFSGTADCELNSFEPTNSHNGTGMSCQNSATFPNNLLVKFDGISNIPAASSIISATLYLWLSSENALVTATIVARRVLRNWVDSQATWNAYSTGNNWTTAGCLGDGTDRVATQSASMNLGDGSARYWAMTGLAADVQLFVDGTANYGWVYQLTTPTGEWKNFVTDTGGNLSRPYLEVVYSIGGGAQKTMLLGVG